MQLDVTREALGLAARTPARSSVPLLAHPVPGALPAASSGSGTSVSTPQRGEVKLTSAQLRTVSSLLEIAASLDSRGASGEAAKMVARASALSAQAVQAAPQASCIMRLNGDYLTRFQTNYYMKYQGQFLKKQHMSLETENMLLL